MDLQYGKACAPTLKRFDDSGLVLQVASFSNSLAPGYGMGWLVPGRFREKIMQMKFASNLLSGGIFQRAVADYMQSGNFNRHLRSLRTKLHARMEHGLDLIQHHFPKGCTVDKAVRRLHVLDRRTAGIRFGCRVPRRSGPRDRIAARPAVFGPRTISQLHRFKSFISMDAGCRSEAEGNRRFDRRAFVTTTNGHASAARPQSSAVASLAPSVSASSLAHIIEG